MEKHYIIGALVTIVGLACIFLRKKFAKYAIHFQEKFFGLHFKELDHKIAKWLNVLVGFAFIAWGAAVMLGMLSLRS